MATLREKRGRAAYKIVDLSKLDKKIAAELIEDAQAGGVEYGLRVVETAINGASETPIYGVYYGDDEDKFADAEARLRVEDGELVDLGVEDEDADDLRRDAQTITDEEAKVATEAEEKAIREVTKDEKTGEPVKKEGATPPPTGRTPPNKLNDGIK